MKSAAEYYQQLKEEFQKGDPKSGLNSRVSTLEELAIFAMEAWAKGVPLTDLLSSSESVDGNDKPENSWNYRVCKTENAEYEDEVHDLYSIHTAYYTKEKIKAISKESVSLKDFTSKAELKEQMQFMLKAFNKEVIDLDTIDFTKKPELDL